MSGKMKVLVIASIFIAGLAVMLLIGPAQGAKPASVLSLMASFEPTWIDGSSANRIRNDADGMVYANTPSTKRGFYGVDVTYTPAQWFLPGQFVMKIDRNGLLGRYVKLDFQDPSTDPACDESGNPGFRRRSASGRGRRARNQEDRDLNVGCPRQERRRNAVCATSTSASTWTRCRPGIRSSSASGSGSRRRIRFSTASTIWAS